jgi:glycosyltransferase involved in cell wall biosynthesis
MQNKEQPLLSICIPTFNRAEILKIALQKLLPQVESYKELIEVVISDNASTDHTQKIIENFISKYPQISFNLFIQKFNTGYYGNFKKCRELSKGKYFWLLSDNDHINDDLIKEIIEVLINKINTVGVIYLHSIPNCIGFNKYEVTFEEINGKHKEYALMLISSVIVYNNKEQDVEIFKNFENNDFLGFIYFIQALEYSKNIVVIEGNIFNQYPTAVTFNIFKSWIEDIMACVYYLKGKNIVANESLIDLVNGFLERVVVHHVHRYVTYGNILGKKYGGLPELRKRMDNYYSDYEYYKKVIRPYFSKNRKVLLIQDLLRKIVRKIKNIDISFN